MDVEPESRSKTGACGVLSGWLQALSSVALRTTKVMSKSVEKTFVLAASVWIR